MHQIEPLMLLKKIHGDKTLYLYLHIHVNSSQLLKTGHILVFFESSNEMFIWEANDLTKDLNQHLSVINLYMK